VSPLKTPDGSEVMLLEYKYREDRDMRPPKAPYSIEVIELLNRCKDLRYVSPLKTPDGSEVMLLEYKYRE